jgi:signal transduction histidine kinase
LLNPEGEVIRRILARPNQSPEVSRRNVNIVMEEGLAGWVYRHQHGALAADALRDERWVHLPDDDEPTGSALVVPLLYQQRVNGLLALHHERVRYFDESHLALAAGIAGQAAVAVENARLYTQVKSEHETLYAFINAMPIPVLLVDPHNTVIFANEAARRSLLVKMVDLPLAAVTGGPQLKTALEGLRSRNETQMELRWADERVFNLTINELENLGTVIALNDITYLKELDAIKSQFVETVSHDLKNPLGVIMGFAQLLQSESLTPAGQASLDSILRSGKQMQSLIKSLLDLAQIEAGTESQVEPCDLVEIVEQVLADFQLALDEKQIDLYTDLPSDLPPVSGDALRLTQVVSNLVSNAIKYTPAEGQITVRVRLTPAGLRLEVSDTGPGIAPAAQAQLFQKFYRVPELESSEKSPGTGLGLSIVKAIVESYQGRVGVHSEVGRGSTFYCVLPVAIEAVGEQFLEEENRRGDQA